MTTYDFATWRRFAAFYSKGYGGSARRRRPRRRRGRPWNWRCKRRRRAWRCRRSASSPTLAGLRSAWTAYDTPRRRPCPDSRFNLLRTYEDHVLGKLYSDATFARAAEALRRYEERDRMRGLAFLLSRFTERSGFDGVHFSPGVLKGLLETPPDDLLRQGWESFRQHGVHELNERLIQSLIAAMRRTTDVLGSDDVAALEAGDALAGEGEQVARRQVRQAAAALEAALPRHGPRPEEGRARRPRALLDEDAYPVGGFSSISTRGALKAFYTRNWLTWKRKSGPTCST